MELELSNADIPFEGVEKRLVVWLDKLAENIDWERILERAQCRILSSITTRESLKIYLLSESTLITWENGFVMKTCGRTTPFLALELFLEIYPESEIEWIVYTRLEFMHPKYQPYPHSSFEDECCFFGERLFKNYQARVLPFGERPLNVIKYVSPLSKIESDKFAEKNSFISEEYLLIGIFEDCVERFTSRSSLGNESPIQKAIPRDLDEFWFEPVGYSCNALLGEPEYFDCHISPEPITSYASLEVGSVRGENPSSLDVSMLLPSFAPETIHFIRTSVNTRRDSVKSPEGYILVHTETADFGMSEFVYQVYSRSTISSSITTREAFSSPSNGSLDTDEESN